MAKTVSCWCYVAAKMVLVRGEVVGRRAADLLKVNDCLEVGCLHGGVPDCLVGKIRESRWP